MLVLLFAVEDGEVFDFRGMRLDWFRLQVHHFTRLYCSFDVPLHLLLSPL